MSDKAYTIYSKPSCGFCNKAKNLLDSLNIPYNEIDISKDSSLRVWLKSQGFKTVPQIFLDDVHVGGYDKLEDFLVENDDRFYI